MKEIEDNCKFDAEKACNFVYMSIHVSELSKYNPSIQRAWYVGRAVWEKQKENKNDKKNQKSTKTRKA